MMAKKIVFLDQRTKHKKRGHPPKYYRDESGRFLKTPGYQDKRDKKRERSELRRKLKEEEVKEQ